MRVRRYRSDDALAVATLHETNTAELRERDAKRGETRLRWVAEVDGEVVAAATALIRPDDRAFLRFVGPSTYFGALARRASAQLGRPVYAHADDSDSSLLAALQEAGFTTEMVADRFRVTFADALAKLHRRADCERTAWAQPPIRDALRFQARRTGGWTDRR